MTNVLALGTRVKTGVPLGVTLGANVETANGVSSGGACKVGNAGAIVAGMRDGISVGRAVGMAVGISWVMTRGVKVGCISTSRIGV